MVLRLPSINETYQRSCCVFFGKLLRILQGLRKPLSTSLQHLEEKNNIFLSPLGIWLQTPSDLDKPWDFPGFNSNSTFRVGMHVKSHHLHPESDGKNMPWI